MPGLEHRLSPLVEPNQQAVLSYIGLRRAVGAIGVALPFVLWFGAFVVGADWQPSISAYYHTEMRDVLVGALCAIGVFLFSYKFGRLDSWAANVAAVTAIGVALVPTPRGADATGWEAVAGVLHVVFSGVFLLTLAFFSLVLFTRTKPGGQPTPRKQIRNRVYVTCGVVIIACVLLIVLTPVAVPAPVKDALHPVFWWEAIAIVAFGVSWFVKGETLWRDQRRAAGPPDCDERADRAR
jgi:hypothetical protein